MLVGSVRFRIGNYLIPASIEQRGNRYYINFRYHEKLKDEIKVMEGARWHGFDENPEKIWSIADSARNRFQLRYLIGEKVYSNYDKPEEEFTPRRKECYSHQIEMTRHMINRRHCIVAAEMGCVDGSSKVHLNRAGRGFSLTLERLYYKWHNGVDRGRVWDLNVPTYIRSLCGDTFRLNRIENVLYKGYKPVFCLKTISGKEVNLTSDHEVCVGLDSYRALSELNIGDIVLSNGSWIDKDGYVRVGGYKGKHPRWTTGGIYEHILVMEAYLGRYLEPHERVHHKNHIRHDNDINNLQLYNSDSEHLADHGKVNYRNLHNGNKVFFLPYKDKIVSIDYVGERRVYDIVCADPYRNFVANDITVHNCGKTLSAIEAMEWAKEQWQLRQEDFIWVGPRSALIAVQLEFYKWKSRVWPTFYTYEALIRVIENWPNKKAPRCVVFDEASKIKTSAAQRSKAAKYLADNIRNEWNLDSLIILMTGTPAPKSPVDWWHLCETSCPGFLREGNTERFKQRLGLIQKSESFDGNSYPKLITWWDNEDKCTICGQVKDHSNHTIEVDVPDLFHNYQKSVNEVAKLYRRMKGLVYVKFKRDCLDLPEKRFRKIYLKPSEEILRAMQLILASSPTTIKAMTLCRELSDGFQYVEVPSGETICPSCVGTLEIDEYFDMANPDDMLTNEEIAEGKRIRYNEEGIRVSIEKNPFEKGTRKIRCTNCKNGKVPTYTRETKEVPCPKEDSLINLLEEYEEEGRIVIWGGFTGSIDRCVRICRKAGWEIIRLDGRGWQSSIPGSGLELIKLFQEGQVEFPKVAFIGQADAGGMGLNLTAASAAIYYSNTFKFESKAQSTDRIHRPGADHNRGVTIYELIHLPTDLKILENLDLKRDLMHQSMGLLKDEIEKINIEDTYNRID